MYYQATFTCHNISESTARLKRKNIAVSDVLYQQSQQNCRIYLYMQNESEITMIAKTTMAFDRDEDIQHWFQLHLQHLELEYEDLDIRPMPYSSFRSSRNINSIMGVEQEKLLVDSELLDAFETRRSRTRFVFRDRLIPLDVPTINPFEALLSDEIRRIQSNPQQRFLGHPVHYLIHGQKSNAAKNLTHELIRIMVKAKRLVQPRMTYISHLNENDDVSLEEGIDMAVGGVLFINIDDEDFLDIGEDRLRISLAETAKEMIEKRHEVLYVLYSQHPDGHALRMLLNELSALSFVTFTIRDLDRDAALTMIQLHLQKEGLDTDYAQQILPSVGETFRKEEVEQLIFQWYDMFLRKEVFPEYKDVPTIESKRLQRPVGGAYDELQAMIGLDNVKAIIDDFLQAQQAQQAYKKAGIKVKPMTRHMVFTGNPGTAKTSVARLVGTILRDNGLLPIGGLVEVGRSDLVGEYVGHTAVKVKKAFKRAKGCVLFIDEAYSLVDHYRSSFGDEAINTIVMELENHREDTLVIFAGYPEPMEQFLKQNPGLKSRIGFEVHFDNYSISELVDIGRLLIHQQGFSISEEGITELRRVISETKDVQDGNGRLVRNIVERAILRHGVRLYQQGIEYATSEDIIELTEDDFIDSSEQSVIRILS
jgi:hypothetical protein